MKKIIFYFLIMFFIFSGCTSLKSNVGAIPTGELYIHRIPTKQDVQKVVVDDKGVVRQIIPWGEVTNNASRIGNSVANIVGAVRGSFGFPFNIIPELTEISLKGARSLKEETENQEVYKLNWCEGMKNLDVTLADGTRLKVNSNVEVSLDSNNKTDETKIQG